MMPNIPTISGANPNVSTWGTQHGFIRTVTRLGPDAAASVSLNITKDFTLGVVRPVLYIYGSASATPPHPGTYNPLSPAYGLFFSVPFYQSGSGPSVTYYSALRVRFRGASSSGPNIGIDAYPNETWTDAAADTPAWSTWTQNYVGNAGVYLDLAFDGNTSNYQTYIIQNTFTA